MSNNSKPTTASLVVNDPNRSVLVSAAMAVLMVLSVRVKSSLQICFRLVGIQLAHPTAPQVMLPFKLKEISLHGDTSLPICSNYVETL